jgi:hypothetical protein
VVLICYEGRVTWRHLSYYFPDVPLYVLHAAADAPAWLLRGRTMEEPEVRDGAYVLPADATVLWVVEPPAAPSIDPPAEAAGPVFRSGAGPFSFRHYRFVRGQL